MRLRPVTRRAGGVCAAGLALGALTGCGPSGDPPAPSARPPATAAPPTEGDLPPGWDEAPDSPVVPDHELSQADVDALLRVTATGPQDATTCDGNAVTYELTGFDAALGHRYATLVVTNTGEGACTVSGYVGLGARGTWGHRLELLAEQRAADGGAATPRPVELPPGGSARAALEWTGELAGAESEPVSSLAVQLAHGQPARLVTAVGLDIGMLTTVRIGPLTPAP
ncbi:DUF4232 domain-containing protein [Actinotalea sp. JY-7876]|uniref:DUF4232 domain-containing protein n=2 Tax=unclassified Actinotalea TaxID=2638618 RepID=UPI0015F3E766|nr:DUF4232 domain-containing protein [Actinotalea sp. JY-7876]